MTIRLKLKEHTIPTTFKTKPAIRECLEDAVAMSGLGIGDTINAALSHYFITHFAPLAERHGLVRPSGRG